MGRRPLHGIQATLAARRYFLGQQTKSQIADELGVSRFKAARLIDAAIKQRIICFVITEPEDLNVELGEKMRSKYRLKAVLALDGPDLPTNALTAPLGGLAASLLDEILVDGQVLGISQNPVELVHRLASLSGAAAHPVYGPMWKEDATLAQRPRQESTVASAMSKYDSIDVLVVAIGWWRPNPASARDSRSRGATRCSRPASRPTFAGRRST